MKQYRWQCEECKYQHILPDWFPTWTNKITFWLGIEKTLIYAIVNGKTGIWCSPCIEKLRKQR